MQNLLVWNKYENDPEKYKQTTLTHQENANRLRKKINPYYYDFSFSPIEHTSINDIFGLPENYKIDVVSIELIAPGDMCVLSVYVDGDSSTNNFCEKFENIVIAYEFIYLEDFINLTMKDVFDKNRREKLGALSNE